MSTVTCGQSRLRGNAAMAGGAAGQGAIHVPGYIKRERVIWAGVRAARPTAASRRRPVEVEVTREGAERPAGLPVGARGMQPNY